MEIANQQKSAFLASDIRIASRADSHQITHLLQHAAHSHWHVDWRPPGDWIGQKGFVLLTQNGDKSLDSFRFHTPPDLLGCLAVTADPAPASWVRVVGVKNGLRPFPALSAMMDKVVETLQGTAVTEINWLATQTWPLSYLPMMGFEVVNHIETYRKDGMAIPPLAPVSGLTFRRVETTDMPLLAEIEVEGFAPRWRYSADGLRLAQGQAFSFELAQIAGEVVGYQLSTPTERGVHLVRLVVRPSWHGRGFGSALLAHALLGYQSRGVNQVTLNTQIDNIPSQIVYKKFGFVPTGEKFPVWAKQL